MEQCSDNAMSKIASKFGMGKSLAGGCGLKSPWHGIYRNRPTEVLTNSCDNPFFQAVKVAALSSKEAAQPKEEHGVESVGTKV